MGRPCSLVSVSIDGGERINSSVGCDGSGGRSFFSFTPVFLHFSPASNPLANQDPCNGGFSFNEAAAAGCADAGEGQILNPNLPPCGDPFIPPCSDAINDASYLLEIPLGIAGLARAIVANVARAGVGAVKEGITVFRVFGGEARGLGRSFTTVNPGEVANFRQSAGLFPGNTGQFVLEGRLTNTQGVLFREALPGPNGVGGGLPELGA